LPRYINGPWTAHLGEFDEIAYFVLYWVILGVASSIGLGTGLHTFVLYLGPRIAKIAMQAYFCNSLPILLPNKFSFTHFGECSAGNNVTFWDILGSVQLEAFLWGFGTAIGELPPYFIARAAA